MDGAPPITSTSRSESTSTVSSNPESAPVPTAADGVTYRSRRNGSEHAIYSSPSLPTAQNRQQRSGSVASGAHCSQSTDCVSGLQCTHGICQTTWSAQDFSDGTSTTPISSKWNVMKDAYGKANRAIVNDPSNSSMSSSKVLQVKYPQGSIDPASSIVGGTGFYASPLDISKFNTIMFEFQVYFPSGFQWVLGGKLPGLIGGHNSCSGGNAATDCFSTRKMWRKNGAGESYLYINKAAQVPTICSAIPGTVCHEKDGYSIGRGSFSFSSGNWTSVREVVSLNTCTSASGCKQDGGLDIYINDIAVFSLRQIAWRINASVLPVGIDFETFFGGNDASYATPTTQYTYFKGVVLSGY